MKRLRSNEPDQCVGCGYCCIKAMCSVGVYFNDGKREDRCPFLVWDEEVNRYFCKLVVDGTIIPEALGIGLGCCSNLNSWRKDVKRR